MATTIRANLSTNNKYYVPKHRYYELKHFCLQYKEWRKIYASLLDIGLTVPYLESTRKSGVTDLTAKYASERAYYSKRIRLIESTATDADPYLANYILQAVTENLSYTYLKSRLDVPCGKDMYYDRYRRFFWLLDKSRD